MKTGLSAKAAKESSSSSENDDDGWRRAQKLLGLCLIRDRLLLLERNIGMDVDLLKQTLVGCFVRVPVQGLPTLVLIRPAVNADYGFLVECAIDTRFKRGRLFLPSVGYFEFDQVEMDMPNLFDMKSWCIGWEQKGRAPLSDEFIEAKRAQIIKYRYMIKSGPTKVEEPQSAEEIVSSMSTGTLGTSARKVGNKENGGAAGQSDEDEEEEENTSVKAEELPELPNVDGLVQNTELFVQVLLPCDEFLKFFSLPAETNVISLATAGCLMAFRIAGKNRDQRKQVIVDEITGVKHQHDRTKPCDVHFKLGEKPVNVSKLMTVHESEVTDRVFDQWLQCLAFKDEPVPAVQAKYERKVHALAQLENAWKSAQLDVALAKSNGAQQVASSSSSHSTPTTNTKKEQQNQQFSLPVGPSTVQPGMARAAPHHQPGQQQPAEFGGHSRPPPPSFFNRGPGPFGQQQLQQNRRRNAPANGEINNEKFGKRQRRN